jgi:hypothetical protein
MGEISSLLMDFVVASTSGSTCLMKYPVIFSSPNYYLSFLTVFPIPMIQYFVLFSRALEADFIHLLIIGNPLEDLQNAVHPQCPHSFLDRQLPQVLNAGALLDRILDHFCSYK